MPDRRVVAPLLLAGALLLPAGSGCGGTDRCDDRGRDGGGGADGAGLSPADEAALAAFTNGLAEAMCGLMFRCCSLPEINALGHSRFLTQAECRMATLAELELRLSEYRFALREGRVTLDPALATACIARFAGGSCPQVEEPGLGSPFSIWERFAACANPFVGALETGELCFMASECRPGATCRRGLGEVAQERVGTDGIRTVPLFDDPLLGFRGRCTVDVKEGEACALTTQCASGLYCRGTDRVCARPARAGEACLVNRDESFDPIETLVACGQTPNRLLCVGGQCRRLPIDGEPCLPDTLGLPVCDPAPELQLSCVGVGFNGTGICKKAAQRGEPCSFGLGLPSCAPPLTCLIADDGLGTCGAAPQAGSPCSETSRCAAPAVCYGIRNICVLPPPVRDGSTCLSDVDCASLVCITSGVPGTTPGICASQAVPGGECAGPGGFVGGGGNPPPEGKDGGGAP